MAACTLTGRRRFIEVCDVALQPSNADVRLISVFFTVFVWRYSELEASRTAADAQAAKQAQLEKQLEAALLDKKRLQDLDSGES